MEKKDYKSKLADNIFYIVLIFLIIVSVGITFYKIVIQKDYQIEAKVSCDPNMEKCFSYMCDPVSDESCPINENERTSYYKIINKKASSIELCQFTDEKVGCDKELSCTQDEIDCSYILCDENNISEGEFCSY